MKYLIFLLSFVAFCYSVPINIGQSKHITLDEDDNITIDGSQGKKVVISRAQGSTGQRNVEIFMEDQTESKKKIWFREQSNMEDTEHGSQKGMTEVDILVRIFKNHQGDIDDDTYENILKQIRHFVMTGHVDVNVLNILKSFDTDEDDEFSTDIGQTLNAKSLQKLLRLLRTLGMSQGSIDIDQLVRKDPMFMNRILQQEPIFTIKKGDIMYLNSLIQSQQQPMVMGQPWMSQNYPMSLSSRFEQTQQNPISMTRQGMPLDLNTLRQNQAMMGMEQENPSFLIQPQVTQEDLMKMKLKIMLMKDPRYQRMFMKPNMMTDPDMDTIYEMKYGIDLDDLRRNQMMSEEGKFMMMKEMDPEMMGGKMTTEKLMRLEDQMEKEEMFRRLRDQMMGRPRTQWQKHSIFRSPPDQKDRMMMDRMMPMM